MSLDKAIEHGKEYREPYYGSKAVDKSCRCGGDCPYCRKNPPRRDRRLEIKAQDALNEGEDMWPCEEEYYDHDDFI
jgi:hypothetical protein